MVSDEGEEAAGEKKREPFIPYDYEAAYNKELEDMHEWVVEQMLSMSSTALCDIGHPQHPVLVRP